MPVVRNFKRVIEKRDITLMKKELYMFLNLHCGFIAHYNIDGFKAAYSDSRNFEGVFIRHFDSEHQYFSGIYQCHKDPYKETGYTKAEIKQAFFRIVDTHKPAIERWSRLKMQAERRAVYLRLKQEFAPEERGVVVDCEACGTQYDIKVVLEGRAYTDFGIICCLFCGHQIKMKGEEIDVECAEQRKAG